MVLWISLFCIFVPFLIDRLYNSRSKIKMDAVGGSVAPKAVGDLGCLSSTIVLLGFIGAFFSGISMLVVLFGPFDESNLNISSKVISDQELVSAKSIQNSSCIRCVCSLGEDYQYDEYNMLDVTVIRRKDVKPHIVTVQYSEQEEMLWLEPVKKEKHELKYRIYISPEISQAFDVEG